MKNKKIVVTGGSGNLGQWTIRVLLEDGYDVLNLDSVPTEKKLCETWITDLGQVGDLYEALKGVGAVIHLAAHQAPFVASDTQVFRNNMTATYNVFKAATDMGVGKIVHASSIAAYGFAYAPEMFKPNYLPLDEVHPLKPKDPYAFSKVFGEQIADSYAGISPLSVVSLRLAGINFDLNFETLPERWLDPGLRLGTFWSYVDVRDAAEACKLSVELQGQGHYIFNIAAEKSRFPVPTSELVNQYIPGIKIKDGMTGLWSGLDSSRARSELGFEDKYVWQDYIRGDGSKK